jgi:hypothetical protein
MADAYVLSEADVRALRRIAQRDRGDPVNHQPPLQGQSHPGKLPVARLGIAYGTLPAAQYDGGGTLVRPGKGECKMHRLQADGTAVIDLDDLPTPAFSVMPYEVAHGKELLLLRDQTLEGDDENVAEPGYLALRWQQSEETPQTVERCLYLCGSESHILQNNDLDQKLYLLNVHNFDTSTYGIDADAHAIELKRVGIYEIRHDWRIDPTTTVSEGSERATVHLRRGSSLPLSSFEGCFTLHLGTYTSNSADHDLASAGCTWYIHRKANGEWTWVDWVARRIALQNGATINLATARFRYLGDLGLPTVETFTDPDTL